MAIEDFLLFPNTILEVIKHCTEHPCRVTKCGDPKCCGGVKVMCAGLWDDKESNWIYRRGMSVGSTKDKKKGSGDWSPSRPGEYGVIGFVAGNPLYPYYEPMGPGAADKGNAGTA